MEALQRYFLIVVLSVCNSIFASTASFEFENRSSKDVWIAIGQWRPLPLEDAAILQAVFTQSGAQLQYKERAFIDNPERLFTHINASYIQLPKELMQKYGASGFIRVKPYDKVAITQKFEQKGKRKAMSYGDWWAYRSRDQEEVITPFELWKPYAIYIWTSAPAPQLSQSSPFVFFQKNAQFLGGFINTTGYIVDIRSYRDLQAGPLLKAEQLKFIYPAPRTTQGLHVYTTPLKKSVRLTWDGKELVPGKWYDPSGAENVVKAEIFNITNKLGSVSKDEYMRLGIVPAPNMILKNSTKKNFTVLLFESGYNEIRFIYDLINLPINGIHELYVTPSKTMTVAFADAGNSTLMHQLQSLMQQRKDIKQFSEAFEKIEKDLTIFTISGEHMYWFNVVPDGDSYNLVPFEPYTPPAKKAPTQKDVTRKEDIDIESYTQESFLPEFDMKQLEGW